MYRHAWLLLVFLLPYFAWAQEEADPEAGEAEPPEAAEPADATEADEADEAAEPVEAGAYVIHEASGFGFSIRLPEGGLITDPASEDWTADAEVAFEWTATAELPMTLILGRVEHFESQLDTDTFNAFCDALR